MPQLIVENKVSWADEVDAADADEALPAPTVIIEKDIKMVIEYRIRPDGKKSVHARNPIATYHKCLIRREVAMGLPAGTDQNTIRQEKIVRYYKIVRRPVSKGIAERKSWAKFGAAALDKPGPNPGTTILAEDVRMEFVAPKVDAEEEPAEKHKGLPVKVVKCRHCNGDHWTLKCPFGSPPTPDSKATPPKENASSAVPEKYVPPCLREEGKRERETRRPDAIAIRVANLSENAEEPDLADLVRPFGVHTRLFLPKDKVTGLCRGFAYVHFNSKDEAARVIKGLNGHGYDHLILRVDWAKPQNQKSRA